MLHFSRPLQFKFAASGLAEGEIEGLGAAFGNTDSYGDVIRPGAFKASLQRHEADGTRPKLLWQHDSKQPIGTWTDVREVARGLHVRGQLALGTERGREAHELLVAGALDGLSIGFEVPDDGYSLSADGLRELHEVHVWEVSVVTFPANASARVTEVKTSAAISDPRSFERALRDQLGFSSRQAKTLCAGGWRALRNEPPEDAENLLDEIRRICARIEQ